MKFVARSLLALTILAGAAQAADGDLVLPGERYVTYFDRYVCRTFDDEGIQTPKGFADRGIAWEKLSSDRGLDNFLLTAQFTEDGATCRFSVLFTVDYDTDTATAYESKAYAAEGESDCAEGKAYLDSLTSEFRYAYVEHPHKIALLFPVEGMEEVCGEDATFVAPRFTFRR